MKVSKSELKALALIVGVNVSVLEEVYLIAESDMVDECLISVKSEDF